MLHEISFNGFEPEPSLEENLRADLVNLLEFCPCDAIADAGICKLGGTFEVQVLVRFVGGEFQSEAISSSPRGALKANLDRLYEEIRQWRSQRFAAGPDSISVDDYAFENQDLALPREQMKPSQLRILIVDDEKSSVRGLQACLKKMNCDVTVVDNGQDAVSKIISQSFDLMFLDWQMPEMGGAETLVKAEGLNSLDPILDYQWSALRLPVITYSGCRRKELVLPDTRHFRFIDHWNKDMPLNSLKDRASKVVSQIEVGLRDA